jgi:RNA polymerase sigma-70 factor (family 1)
MARFTHLTDDELVVLLKQGDELAFAEVYKRYAEKLAGFAGSKLYSLEDARDILHDVFVKLWEGREQLHITSNLQSYLFAVIRHRIIDKIRKNITREEYASAVQSMAVFYDSDAGKQVELKELKKTIGDSLNQLSPRIKEIYKLSREEGLSNREIAEKLNLSEQTVKNQLSAALKHLRQTLGPLGLLVLVACSLSVQAQSKKIDQPLADSLAKWAILDQTAAGPRQGRFKEMTTAQRVHYSDSVFAVNEQRLKSIFDKYGFPGYDLVGEKGSNNFWLMVQHCDKDVSFQQAILKAMKAELPKRNADPKNFAYLADRVAINTGGKQIYGTQLTYNTDSCQAIPKPLEDSLNVDKRRAAIGLEPIESYLNWMSQMHFDMNKEVYEKKGIYQPKLIPEPKQ